MIPLTTSFINRLRKRALRARSHIVLVARRHLYNFSRSRHNALISQLMAHPTKQGRGDILCDGLWDHPLHWLRQALFLLALRRQHGGKLIGVREFGCGPNQASSLRALGIDQDHVLPERPSDKDVERAKALLSSVDPMASLLSLQLPFGFPAYMFYDGVLKIERVGSASLRTNNLSAHLSVLLSYLDSYESLFLEHDFSAVVLSHPVHFRFSTAMWHALRRGIPVFILNYRNEHITIKRLNGIDDICNTMDAPEDKLLPSLSTAMRKRLIDVGRGYTAALRSGGVGDIRRFGNYGGKQMGREEVARLIGSDPGLPNAIIMSPAFPDFPNSTGPCYFADYVEWINITIQAVKDLKNCNWIFKEHPAIAAYDTEDTLTNFIKPHLGSNIHLWPQGLSASLIDGFADLVVTARGSGGIEYPAIGINAIVARPAFYSGWGTTYTTSSQEEYRALLARAHLLAKLTEEKREDALILVALVDTSAPETRAGYEYPIGADGARLWPKIPRFIKKTWPSLRREVEMISRWLQSGEHSYNVFKHMNYRDW